MNETETLYEMLAKNYIEKAINDLKEIERKRKSCPNIELTDMEFEVLVGIANGRSSEEVEKAIHLYTKNECYNSVVRCLFRKFEAFTLAHVVYKAMKKGILN